MGIISLLLFLFLFPLVMGYSLLIFIRGNKKSNLIGSLPLGYFIEMSLFQLLSVPFTLLRWPFINLCWSMIVSSFLICGFSGFCLYNYRGQLTFSIHLRKWEVFYAVILFFLLGWQIYKMIVSDITVMSYDDAYYVALANDTLEYNSLFLHDPYTGLATRLNTNRLLQSSLIFPAFLSYISGIRVIVIEHSVLAVYYIILAYLAAAWFSCIVFQNNEKRLVFLIFLCILYIFGYYSPYSATFRLLGPNYQGKAVLAVSYLPVLITILILLLSQPYKHLCGAVFMLFSIAAATFTLFGPVVVIANTLVIISLSMLGKKRTWKYLLYFLWGGLFPMIYCCFFFINRLIV